MKVGKFLYEAWKHLKPPKLILVMETTSAAVLTNADEFQTKNVCLEYDALVNCCAHE